MNFHIFNNPPSDSDAASLMTALGFGGHGGGGGEISHMKTSLRLKQCEGPPVSAACKAGTALKGRALLHFSFTFDSPT